MRRYLLVFLSLVFLVPSTASVTCNATSLNFVSKFTLGKQDQLNRTYSKIQERIQTLNDISYSSPSGPTYTLSNIIPIFYYRDTKQNAVFRGEDVIIIDGGTLEITISFNWTKQSLTIVKGTGQAIGISYELMFAKKLVINNNTEYSYQLLDAMPFKMPTSDAFRLTRIDPADTTEADQGVILSMFNDQGSKDVKTSLQVEIQKIYLYFLGYSLHDEHFPIDLQFDYKWVPKTDGKPNLTISFTRRPVSVDVEAYGLVSMFQLQIQSDQKWQCGSRSIPTIPLSTKTYGGIQQYLSFDLYHNVLRWALQNKVLDTDLRQETWSSRMFQFYAGDLYEVFSNIQSKYYASNPVIGKCNGNPMNLNVKKNTDSRFNVTLRFDCDLQIRNQKVAQFTVDLQLTLAGQPISNALNFILVSHSQSVSFVQQGQYRLVNKDLAELMVGHSLNRLYEGNIFGSGWPQSPPRDYPSFRVESNYTMVFDTTYTSNAERLRIFSK